MRVEQFFCWCNITSPLASRIECRELLEGALFIACIYFAFIDHLPEKLDGTVIHIAGYGVGVAVFAAVGIAVAHGVFK